MKKFRSHPKLREWTKAFTDKKEKISSAIFKTDFHTFYYSFLVGVSKNEMANDEDLKDSVEMSVDFTTDFKPVKMHIISVLISAYLKEQGYELEDAENVKKMVRALIDVDSNNLSSEGFKRINQYAYRGFEIIEKNNPWPNDPAASIDKIFKNFK